MKKLNLTLKIARTTIVVFLTALSLGACNKFIDVPKPSNVITSADVFSNDASITSALTGAYYTLSSQSSVESTYPTLFSDELVKKYASGQDVQAEDNTYNSGTDYGFLNYYYQVIYQANDIIESLSAPGALHDATATQAIGEAYFLRAYCYFKLVNFYGPVPLVIVTNVNITALQPNTPVATSYAQMVSDLNKANSLVSTDYPDAYRGRVNKAVVAAMLSKVYLYQQDWKDAEAAASTVISSNTYSLDSLNNVFLNGSTETIWQFWNQNGFTYIANYFIPSSSFANNTVRPGLIAAIEPGDMRKTAWLQQVSNGTSYYPYKYKQTDNAYGPAAEYEVQLRLGELYLIRAEARAKQNNLSGGLADVNVIRQRAGLTPAITTSQSDLLLKVEQERRVELMFEEGNRWFDLNRTGRTAYWLAPIKPTFTAHAELLPIPATVIQTNPNLKQNPGY